MAYITIPDLERQYKALKVRYNRVKIIIDSIEGETLQKRVLKEELKEVLKRIESVGEELNEVKYGYRGV